MKIAIVLFVTCFAGVAVAETVWNVPTGEWSVAGNWLGGVPNASTDARIGNGGICNLSSINGEVATLWIREASTLNISKNLTVYGSLADGKNGAPCIINLNAGTLEFDMGSMSVGTEDLGILNMANGTSISIPFGYLVVGKYYYGNFYQNGGSVGTAFLELGELRPDGYPDYGIGYYELNNGTLNVTEGAWIGCKGKGTFVQNGGTFTVSAANGLWMPEQPAGIGIYQLNNGTLNTTRLFVGKEGTATFTQSGGSLQVSGDIKIGVPINYPTGTGSMILNGGTTYTNSLEVGYTNTNGSASLKLGPAGNVTVDSLFKIRLVGSFQADLGAKMLLKGAMELTVDDVNKIAGFTNTAITVKNSSAQLFEVASRDLGAVREGFIGNAALAALTVGDNAATGWCSLSNNYDSSKNGYADALYVKHLTVGPGSSLSTNGINVYYLYADIAPTATVSGTLTKVTLNCSDPLIAKAADVNKDCRVNFADFAELAKEWLNCYDQMNCQ